MFPVMSIAHFGLQIRKERNGKETKGMERTECNGMERKGEWKVTANGMYANGK